MTIFIPAQTITTKPTSFCFVCIKNGTVALEKTPDNSVRLPTAEPANISTNDLSGNILIGQSGSIYYYAVPANGNEAVPANTEFRSIRSLYGLIDENLIYILMLANHLITWHINSQFCGRCGTPTTDSGNEHAKICPSCGNTVYPSPHPATITAVIRENKLLLARHSRFSQMHTVLAGYVNPGESLEECVAREIREEVNIEVTNIRYFKSQPWGLSQSLMAGFTADYSHGEIEVDGDEIIEADWYTKDRLPDYPQGPSLAYYLIKYFMSL